MLSCGGCFAVQIPLTDESHFYKILYDLIAEKWKFLSKIRNFFNLELEGYYNLLIKKFSSVSLWKTDYYHIVGSTDDVIEWYKGSGLRPYLNELPESLHTKFLGDLKEHIEKSFRILDDGSIFLIMPRLFFIAEK